MSAYDLKRTFVSIDARSLKSYASVHTGRVRGAKPSQAIFMRSLQFQLRSQALLR